MSKINEAARKFVSLILKYKNWENIKNLPAHEIKIIFNVVFLAGFNPKKIVPGLLRGNNCEQDGEPVDTYPINYFPFKVLNQKREDDYFATGWLDCLYYAVDREACRQEQIQTVKAAILQSVPLKPIQLTSAGDFLRENHPEPRSMFYQPYFVDHTKDKDSLDACVGVHMHCGGWLDRLNATKMTDAIVCRNCGLRVLFPKTIKTYGELRKVLQNQSLENAA